MPDRNGYIGRAPSDSAVQVARQSYTASGITTDFTFSSGYTPGYFDIYINGVKMIEGSDYTSSDGSTFSILNGGASDGDALEAVAFKAFNAASVTNCIRPNCFWRSDSTWFCILCWIRNISWFCKNSI